MGARSRQAIDIALQQNPDVLLARGQYQERPPLPFTPGIELCGQVVAVGLTGSGRDAVRRRARVIGPSTPSGVMRSR